MGCKLTGDWAKLKAFTRKFPKTLHHALDVEETEQANEVKEAIKQALLGQELAHKPLKPETIKKKGKSDILVDTGAFAESFSVVSHGDGKAIVPMGTTESGISMSELAQIHEYGTSKIPPRPTVRPVYEKVKGEVISEVKEVVKDEIEKYT